MMMMASRLRLLKRLDSGGSRNISSYNSVSSDRIPYMFSIAISSVKQKYLNFNMPGLDMTESDECISVFMKMPGVRQEDVKTDMSTHVLSNVLSIRGVTRDESYLGGKWPREIYRGFMALPVNIDSNTCKIKTEMQDGVLKLTLPKLKLDTHNNNKIDIFRNIINRLDYNLNLRLFASIPSFVLTFARPFVINMFCFHMFDSFTMYKKETDQSLHIRVTPGVQKLDSVGCRAMCVSLNMPELHKLEDVKSFFKHDTLFIEGKANTEKEKVHYVTGILFPHFYVMRRRMIKTEMQDGMYKATIPIADLT